MEEEFIVDYIYLDYQERKKLAAASHEYLTYELNQLKIENMIRWIFICKNSNIWCLLPYEIQHIVSRELYDNPLP
jgi:hypothetical protein